MKKMTEERLYAVNGGDQSDYDFGYKVGQAARTAYDAACDAVDAVKEAASNAWNEVKSWF